MVYVGTKFKGECWIGDPSDGTHWGGRRLHICRLCHQSVCEAHWIGEKHEHSGSYCVHCLEAKKRELG
ncbi:MAG: hypothetical protein EXR48_03330 [Dehalococcoidia bacterium]|nr:hypothetical protein [Dehalococcoidia bacterium]